MFAIIPWRRFDQESVQCKCQYTIFGLFQAHEPRALGPYGLSLACRKKGRPCPQRPDSSRCRPDWGAPCDERRSQEPSAHRAMLQVPLWPRNRPKTSDVRAYPYSRTSRAQYKLNHRPNFPDHLISLALQGSHGDTIPQLPGCRGPKSKFEKAPELAAFVKEHLGKMPLREISKQAKRQFGKHRAPGKSAIHSYWQKTTEKSIRSDIAQPRPAKSSNGGVIYKHCGLIINWNTNHRRRSMCRQVPVIEWNIHATFMAFDKISVFSITYPQKVVCSKVRTRYK